MCARFGASRISGLGTGSPRQEDELPTRRIFELIVITNVLFWPARSTVKLWGKKQLATQPAGSALYTTGEVIATLL
jgi:hypothetical protein